MGIFNHKMCVGNIKSKIKMHMTLASVALLAVTVIQIFGIAEASAGDIEWSGLYRVEGDSIIGNSLDSSVNKHKEYGVHTLILSPKIVAADGLYINAQLNVFNSTDATAAGGANQLGAYFGDGLGSGTPTDVSNSNSASENEKSAEIAVSQFYLTLVQEYGLLIVGRAPLQFGLGMTYNAGRGLFDHFSDTRDLVAYKIVMGNFNFTPMYAKVNEGGLSNYDDVGEINMQLQYENPESDASMGVLYSNRKASHSGNDLPAAAVGGSSMIGPYSAKNFNIFYKKENEKYNVGLEVGQQSGDTGISDGTRNITLSGFGLAAEFEWHPKENKYVFGAKAGMATGDDLSTSDNYEGFIFDRNYDVAMFLFNHTLGRADLLHSGILHNDGTASSHANAVNNQPDVEAISNVTYLSPYMKYKWSDKWSMVGVLTTGWLDIKSANVSGTTYTTDANLGYELDLSLVFNVSEKITWQNQFGYFMPGKAWEVGSNNFGTDNMYGFITKAAVSF